MAVATSLDFRRPFDGEGRLGSVLGVTGDARVQEDEEARLETEEKASVGSPGEVGVMGESAVGTMGPGVVAL